VAAGRERGFCKGLIETLYWLKMGNREEPVGGTPTGAVETTALPQRVAQIGENVNNWKITSE
jgi:hypothetical protein